MASPELPTKHSKKEMRTMAKRAQTSRRKPIRSFYPQVLGLCGLQIPKALVLVSAAAIVSYASQLTLAPVYGGIPTSLYHNMISGFVIVGAWSTIYSPIKLPFRARNVLPLLAFYMPMVQRTTFRYSDIWGPSWGPVITESNTFYLILFFSVSAAAHLVNVRSYAPGGIMSLLCLGVFWVARTLVSMVLRNRIGSSWILTRCGLPNLAGGLYALVSPSLWLLAAIPALLHTTMYNTMCITTPALSETLAAANYTLLARQESNTGYISVLEHRYNNFRALRCDHSILGGIWEKAPPKFAHLDKGTKEPIYTIFVTMEAVRLVDPPPKNPNPKALAIGLGVGTAVNGMIAHGVETDVIELDPVVYRYAKEYFYLRKNHTAYLEDAVTFVKRETNNRGPDRKKYEYILHDVFTGGAVPASLFTQEFFYGLRELLAGDGVIAINWAGDLKLKAARSIIETVRTVFNNCRVFREDMPNEGIADAPVDFTNMVIFCTRSSKSYSFRAPTEADFLNSLARENFLFPKFEINLEAAFDTSGDQPILSESNIGTLVGWQQQSALGHWKVIRTVLPPVVWENY